MAEKVEPVAISVAQFAEAMNISKPTAYQLMQRADFDAAFKVGTRTLVSVERLKLWVQRQTEKGGI